MAGFVQKEVCARTRLCPRRASRPCSCAGNLLLVGVSDLVYGPWLSSLHEGRAIFAHGLAHRPLHGLPVSAFGRNLVHVYMLAPLLL
jgi:hypothetical protein